MREQREVAKGPRLRGARGPPWLLHSRDCWQITACFSAFPTPAGGGPTGTSGTSGTSGTGGTSGTTGTRHFVTLTTVKTFRILGGFHPQSKSIPEIKQANSQMKEEHSFPKDIHRF